METPYEILTDLVCSQCNSQLRRGPVYQRLDGTALCSLCQIQHNTSASRNRVYEAAARALVFPCRHREAGCPASVPFTLAGDSGPGHEATCPLRNLGVKEVEDVMDACGKCEGPTRHVYRDEVYGWLCERCVPALESCENEGCDFKPIVTSQDFLQELVCGQCASLLRRGPVYQRQDGTTSCSLCQLQHNTPASRNHLYEAAARALAFPCRYREAGCPASVPFTPAGDSGPGHEATCPLRNLGEKKVETDVMDACGKCEGPTKHVYRDEVYGWLCQRCVPALEGCDFQPIVTSQDFLQELVCGQCASLLRRGPVYQRQDGTTSCSLCQLQHNTPASRNHLYEAAARALAFPCRYREAGCPASVPFTPAGDSGPGHEAACPLRNSGVKEVEDVMDACGKCEGPTRRVYRDEVYGWLCQRCVPALEGCENEGCDFQDYPGKIHKHTDLFCSHRPHCELCETALAPGSQAQHYQACGALPRVAAGATHRVVRLPAASWFRAGAALCCCRYPGGSLWLAVHAPVEGPQLARYRCEVRVDCAGQTRMYRPNTMYHKRADWMVGNRDNHFLVGDVTVHVSVTCVESI